jgi:flagellar basal body-associated protein FliL
MSNEYNIKDKKKSEIFSNIKIIKIIAIILGILIIAGLVVLFFGLAKGYNKLEKNRDKIVYPINKKTRKNIRIYCISSI